MLADGTADLVQFVERHVVMTVIIAPQDTAIGWPIIGLGEDTGAAGCLYS